MRCEEAAGLISARLDGEVTADERGRLEAHLDSCAACRAVDVALKAQDAQLRHAFDRRRSAAGRVAFQTIARVRAGAARPRPMLLWAQLVGAMAAGFVLAVLLFQTWQKPAAPPRHVAVVPTDAELTLATGPVEVRDAGETRWQWVTGPSPIRRGARLRTPEDVRCELRTRAGTTIRLNADSEFVLCDTSRGELVRGQVWSNTVESRCPLRVMALGTTIVAPASEFDARRQDGELVLTSVSGSPEIHGPGGDVVLADGEAARVVGGVVEDRWCEHDAVFATRWVHELLRMHRADSAEFERRIDALLAGIDVGKPADPYEREIRTFGSESAVSLARYLQSECSADPDSAEPQPTRTEAARILADLAPARVIPDLIDLLSCGDRDVRYHAARALERLTAVDQGLPTDDWRESPCPPCEQTTESWRKWWEQNRANFLGNS